MSNKFRTALIGCGRKARDHANTISKHELLDFTACCDIREEAAAGMAEQFDVASHYTDYEDLFSSEAIQLAVISTQAGQHHELTLAAADYGAHVFCEKPMAFTLAEADEMVEGCNEAGVRLAINHQKHASGYNEFVKKLIADGAIGEVYLITAVCKGGRKAGNELTEMGTHLFDYVRVFGGDVEWAHAHLTTDDREATVDDIRHSQEVNPQDRDAGLVLGHRAFCSFRFRNGIHADVHFRQQPKTDDREYGFNLIGTEGRIALRQSVSTAAFIFRGTHEVLEEGVNWDPLTNPEEDKVAGLDLPELEVNRTLQSRIINSLVAPEDPESPPVSSGEEGRASLEMIHGVWESHRRGSRVPFPLEDRGHPLERWRQEKTNQLHSMEE